jgi:hypothetical protein
VDSEGAVSPTGTEENDGERAGLYLAFIAALAVPGLIVLAFFLPAGPVTDSRRSDPEPPEVEVEGAGERREPVDVQIGEAESIESTNNSTELQEPAAFARRVDLGRIDESTLQFRFTSVRDTAYVVTVRAGSTTVSSFSGRASAGVLVNESVTGLAPGTDHTLEVTLNGPPPASSPQVAFRTTG